MKFPDFNENEIDKEIEYIKTLSLNEAREYFVYLREKYKDEPILEMAKNRREFIENCGKFNFSIHSTICNIICLGDTICPQNNNHWKHELIEFCRNIINVPVEKSVKRTKLAIECVILSYADNYQYGRYTYLDSYIYELSMNDEIKKSKKLNATQVQQREGKHIEQYILPNIDKFVKPNIERVAKLFDAFIEACNKVNLTIFENAIDEFINTVVEINL